MFDMKHNNVIHLVLPRDKTGQIETRPGKFGGFDLNFFVDLNGEKLKLWLDSKFEPSYVVNQLQEAEYVSFMGRFGGYIKKNDGSIYHMLTGSTAGLVPKNKVLAPAVMGHLSGQIIEVKGRIVRIGERTRTFDKDSKVEKVSWKVGTVDVGTNLPTSVCGRYIQTSGTKLVVGSQYDPNLSRFEPCLVASSVCLGELEKTLCARTVQGEESQPPVTGPETSAE